MSIQVAQDAHAKLLGETLLNERYVRFSIYTARSSTPFRDNLDQQDMPE